MSDKVLGYILTETEGVMTKPTIESVQKGFVRIKTILQEGDRENRNRRTYPTRAIAEMLKAPFIQERLRTKTWYGEAGHPSDQNIERQMSIDQTRISHIITEVSQDKNMFRGIVETAMTDTGRDMMGLIQQGSQVAFSFRGMAPVKNESGNIIVQRPIRGLTYDWVIHPSHDVAYMEGLAESVAPTVDLKDEGIMLALTESDARAFLTQSSEQLRTVSDAMEMDLDRSKMTIGEGFVDLYDGVETMRVFLEARVVRDLDHFMLTRL